VRQPLDERREIVHIFERATDNHYIGGDLVQIGTGMLVEIEHNRVGATADHVAREVGATIG
jgi:hypothetical protein